MSLLPLTTAAAILLSTPKKMFGSAALQSLFGVLYCIFRAKEWLLKLKLCLCAASVAESSKTSLTLRFSYAVHAIAMPSNSLARRQGAKAKVLLFVFACEYRKQMS